MVTLAQVRVECNVQSEEVSIELKLLTGCVVTSCAPWCTILAMANKGEGATVRRMWLATELRRLRGERKLTAEQAAAELDWSHSKVSRIEGCKVGVSSTDVAAMCDLYGVPAERKLGIVKIAKQARQKTWHQRDYADVVVDWFSQYVGLEDSATQIRTFEGLTIHGLLQTRDYARAVGKATLVDDEPSEIERKVDLKMGRQAILARKKPPSIWAIVTEGVLRQQVGGPKVMREQIKHLLDLAERPNVTFQVLPFEAGAHAAMTGTFTLMSFPKPFPPVAYVDSLTGSTYLQENADVGRYQLIFDHLIARSLDTERSVDLLKEVVAAH